VSDWREEYLSKIRGLIDEFGWAVQGVAPLVGDSEPSPSFHYTVGLTERSLPELIIFGLDPRLGQRILNEAAERMVLMGDGPYEAGEMVEELLESGYEPMAVDVVDPDKYLTVVSSMYADRPHRAMQLVIPDAEYRFPWDEGYALAQPLLGPPPMRILDLPGVRPEFKQELWTLMQAEAEFVDDAEPKAD
jgi:hypothetical protein